MSESGDRNRAFVVLGFLSVGLGTLGIVLPLLPTTPFMLLAAYLFARSSARWHRWLVRHRVFGPYIHAFRSGRGLTRTQKLRIGTSYTVVMAVSAYLARQPMVSCFLAGLWVCLTLALIRMKAADGVGFQGENAMPVGEDS